MAAAGFNEHRTEGFHGDALTIQLQISLSLKHQIDLVHLLMIVHPRILEDIDQVHGRYAIRILTESAPGISTRAWSGLDFIKLGEVIVFIGTFHGNNGKNLPWKILSQQGAFGQGQRHIIMLSSGPEPAILEHMKAAILLILATALPLSAATPGALENFSTQAGADSWTVYNYADQSFNFPGWAQEADSYIGFSYSANPTDPALFDQGLWFFADVFEASPELFGDYAADGITGIELDVLIENPSALAVMDFAILVGTGIDQRYIFSLDFVGSDFPAQGWYQLIFDFDQPWFEFDETLGVFLEVTLDATTLAQISEIGIRFFPTLVNSETAVAAIDEVKLVPTISAPVIAIDDGGDVVEMSFGREPAHQYTVQSLTAPASWAPVSGQTGISGTGTYLFQTAINQNAQLYRILAEALYTPIITGQ